MPPRYVICYNSVLDLLLGDASMGRWLVLSIIMGLRMLVSDRLYSELMLFKSKSASNTRTGATLWNDPWMSQFSCSSCNSCKYFNGTQLSSDLARFFIRSYTISGLVRKYTIKSAWMCIFACMNSYHSCRMLYMPWCKLPDASIFSTKQYLALNMDRSISLTLLSVWWVCIFSIVNVT